MAKGQVNKGKGKTNKPKLSVKEKKAKKNEKRAAKRNKPGPGPASRDSASLGAVVVGLDLADSCCLGSGRAKTSVARSVSTPETPLPLPRVLSSRVAIRRTADTLAGALSGTSVRLARSDGPRETTRWILHWPLC